MPRKTLAKPASYRVERYWCAACPAKFAEACGRGGRKRRLPIQGAAE